jgi:hypothetical protein
MFFRMPPETTPPDSSPRFARSAEMVACLRRALLYSEKRPRDRLFDAIEAVVGRSAVLTVLRLTRASAAAAGAAAQRSGFAFGNWDVASRAVVNAMLGAGVLLDGAGRPILPGVAAPAAIVDRLGPDHRDRTEAFLLEFLIRSLGDVTVRDHTALAHALFRQFDKTVSRDEMEHRVVFLLARLSDRLELSQETYLPVARPAS